MMKKFLILLTFFALGSCGNQPVNKQSQPASTAQAPAKATYQDNVSLVTSVTPAAGKAASDFSWYDSQGKTVSLSALKGKTVLVNFWATWCGPCKAELPDIEAVSKAYASKGLVVVGVSEDRGDGLVHDVSDFASKNGLTYQIVVDNDDIANAFGNINAIPTSFLVNKDGQIVEKWIGVRDKAFFESTVKKYLD